MNIDVSVLIALVGCALSVGTFFIGRQSSAKNDGLADGELKTDIKYIKTTSEKTEKKLDGVVENYNSIKIELEQLKSRIHELESKVDMLHEMGDGR